MNKKIQIFHFLFFSNLFSLKNDVSLLKNINKLPEVEVEKKIILNVGKYKFSSELREVDRFKDILKKMKKDPDFKNKVLDNFEKEIALEFYLNAKTFCEKNGFLEMASDDQLEKIINFICNLVEDGKWFYSGNLKSDLSSEDLDFLKKEISLYFDFFDKRSSKNKKLKKSDSYQKLLILYFCYMAKQVVSVCLRDLPTHLDKGRFSFLIKKMTDLVSRITDPLKNQQASDFLKSYKRIFDRNFSNKKSSLGEL